jgi:hypothetical protein
MTKAAGLLSLYVAPVARAYVYVGCMLLLLHCAFVIGVVVYRIVRCVPDDDPEA